MATVFVDIEHVGIFVSVLNVYDLEAIKFWVCEPIWKKFIANLAGELET